MLREKPQAPTKRKLPCDEHVWFCSRRVGAGAPVVGLPFSAVVCLFVCLLAPWALLFRCPLTIALGGRPSPRCACVSGPGAWFRWCLPRGPPRLGFVSSAVVGGVGLLLVCGLALALGLRDWILADILNEGVNIERAV